MVLAELGSKITGALRKMTDATVISEQVCRATKILKGNVILAIELSWSDAISWPRILFRIFRNWLVGRFLFFVSSQALSVF
jgi:hypothetical protein